MALGKLTNSTIETKTLGLLLDVMMIAVAVVAVVAVAVVAVVVAAAVVALLSFHTVETMKE